MDINAGTFNVRSDLYAQARPGYPDEFFAWLVSQTEHHSRFWDCACGNGQVSKSMIPYVDEIYARLANAHELVPQLEGPVDFVFCDADKDWYTRYFKALEDNLTPGACFTAHNTNMYGVRQYLEYVRSLPNYKTHIDNRGAGMGITFKEK